MDNPFKELTKEELNTLYFNFISYRDTYCDGWAKMGIIEFYKKYGLSEYRPSAK